MSSFFHTFMKDGIWFDDDQKNQWVVFDDLWEITLYQVIQHTNSITLLAIKKFDSEKELLNENTPLDVAAAYLKNLQSRKNEDGIVISE